jgi:hypothetical protein
MRDAYHQDRYEENRKLIWHFLPPFKKIAKGKNRRFTVSKRMTKLASFCLSTGTLTMIFREQQ